MKNIPRNRDRKKAMKMENTRPKTRRQLVEKDKIIYIYIYMYLMLTDSVRCCQTIPKYVPFIGKDQSKESKKRRE